MGAHGSVWSCDDILLRLPLQRPPSILLLFLMSFVRCRWVSVAFLHVLGPHIVPLSIHVLSPYSFPRLYFPLYSAAFRWKTPWSVPYKRHQTLQNTSHNSRFAITNSSKFWASWNIPFLRSSLRLPSKLLSNKHLTLQKNYKLLSKITNLFRDTNTAFRSTNTTYKQLAKNPNKAQNPSGIYKLVCNTCKMVYVGQSGRAIRTNNPQSAYASHILQNKHEFGPKEEILQLLKTCTKGSRMNC